MNDGTRFFTKVQLMGEVLTSEQAFWGWVYVAADKLRGINSAITVQYGSKKAKEIVGKITGAIRGLIDYEQKGPSVEKMFNVTSDYRYIFVSKDYVCRLFDYPINYLTCNYKGVLISKVLKY